MSSVDQSFLSGLKRHDPLTFSLVLAGDLLVLKFNFQQLASFYPQDQKPAKPIIFTSSLVCVAGTGFGVLTQ